MRIAEFEGKNSGVTFRASRTLGVRVLGDDNFEWNCLSCEISELRKCGNANMDKTLTIKVRTPKVTSLAPKDTLTAVEGTN